MREIVALFASPASSDGHQLGPEMTRRVIEVSRIVMKRHEIVLIASSASGFQPNELYATLVQDGLVSLNVHSSQIVVGSPSASTVAEIDGMERWLREQDKYGVVYVAAGWYQVPRIRFIWWWRYGRQTRPLYFRMKGVPRTYLLLRIMMEPLKFILYFVLPTRVQDEANRKVLGPRGL